MAVSIEFPLNYDRYIALAQQAKEDGRLLEAENYAKQAYKTKPTKTSHLLYFSILFQQALYEEACELAEEKLAYFLENSNQFDLYFESLLASQQFLKAKKTLSRLQHAKLPYDVSIDLDQKGEQIKQAERKQAEQVKKQKEEILEKLYQLSSYSMLDQLAILKQSELVEEDKRFQAYRSILLNPYVGELAKSYCLLDMKNKQCQGRIKLHYFGQEKTVNLTQLPALEQMTAVKELKTLLDQYYKKQIVEYQLIEAEMNLHMMALYPFNDQLIKKVDFWFSLYCKALEGREVDSSDLDEDEKEMLEYFKTLSQADLYLQK